MEKKVFHRLWKRLWKNHLIFNLITRSSLFYKVFNCWNVFLVMCGKLFFIWYQALFFPAFPHYFSGIFAHFVFYVRNLKFLIYLLWFSTIIQMLFTGLSTAFYSFKSLGKPYITRALRVFNSFPPLYCLYFFLILYYLFSLSRARDRSYFLKRLRRADRAVY